jgi:plastocyanin
VILTRRHALGLGGGIAAALLLPRLTDAAGIDVVMEGTADGSIVWFNPVGLHVKPGQTVRWINRDPGNSHTTTAYHPSNGGRPLRLPSAARPWNSDYLLPDDTFAVVFETVGVYDYFCQPHEHAGMVGRIVVGEPGDVAYSDAGLPKAAAEAFPSAAEILAKGRVGR